MGGMKENRKPRKILVLLYLSYCSGREILYGVPGEAPSGEAEYGPGDQMVLRYITDTLSGRVVELYLHYSGTVLDEIVIHTL